MDDDLVLDEQSDRARRLIAVLWPSFIAAALAECAVFAWVDPAMLHIPGIDEPASRQAVYTLAFFAFWMMGAISSAMTLYLLRDLHDDGGDGSP